MDHAFFWEIFGLNFGQVEGAWVYEVDQGNGTIEKVVIEGEAWNFGKVPLEREKQTRQGFNHMEANCPVLPDNEQSFFVQKIPENVNDCGDFQSFEKDF